jgi:hypothetical protein
MPTIFPTPLSLDRGGHGARRAFAHPTISADRGDHRLTLEALKQNLLAERQLHSDLA